MEETLNPAQSINQSSPMPPHMDGDMVYPWCLSSGCIWPYCQVR